MSTDSSLHKRGGSSGSDTVGVERGEGVITMTTTGAQYALAASTRANNSGGSSTTVGVEPKPSVVVVTTSSSSGSGNAAQSQSTRGQQLITVVTSPDPSSPNNLQPIQVCSVTLHNLVNPLLARRFPSFFKFNNSFIRKEILLIRRFYYILNI